MVTDFANNPDCDICIKERFEVFDLMGVVGAIYKAEYDGATRKFGSGTGQWAYMCEEHFDLYGYGLGTGKGQKLKP
jgi:hypothetical protein